MITTNPVKLPVPVAKEEQYEVRLYSQRSAPGRQIFAARCHTEALNRAKKIAKLAGAFHFDLGLAVNSIVEEPQHG